MYNIAQITKYFVIRAAKSEMHDHSWRRVVSSDTQAPRISSRIAIILVLVHYWTEIGYG